LIAYFVLIGFLVTLPVAGQQSKPAPTAPAPGVAAPKAVPRQAVKKAEKGLVFQQMKFGQILISDQQYNIHREAKFYSINGQPIKRHDLKPGDAVDIEYLTGGQRTELYPYYSNERVLTSVRVVPKPTK